MNNLKLQTAFETLLSDVGAGRSRVPEKTVSLFSGQRGSKYEGELMVVGRAVNGYDPSHEPADWENVTVRKTALESAFGRDGKNPLEWVTAMWPPQKNPDGTRGYSAGRSAFWRVIRRVFEHVHASGPTSGWSTHLVWTNLYKVAPVVTGNPSARLRDVQQAAAVNVLSCELMSYSPERVLFLTGNDWFHPFSTPLGFVDVASPAGTLVQRIGRVQIPDCSVKVVVAKHPQGKPEWQFVSEVCQAFGTLDAESQTESVT